jgi:hypothetical protein
VRAPASTAYRLEEGDVLLSIDGRVPESPGHAFRILHSYQPGEQVKLKVMRNRKAVELTAGATRGGRACRHVVPRAGSSSALRTGSGAASATGASERRFGLTAPRARMAAALLACAANAAATSGSSFPKT